MNEDTEKATALDVLHSSELNARLLRRLTASPGVIDVEMLRQIPVRVMGLLAALVSLFDELMARYAIDDGSTRNQPLIMEQQPWLQNVNSYLTNYNSFSATTNQFISIAAAEQKSTAGDSFILPPGTSSREEASTSSQAETFRVHRRPARRAWESDLTTSQTFERSRANQRDGEKLRVADANERIEPAKVIAPSIAPPGELPLAQGQVQRKLPDDGAARAEQRSRQANQKAEAQRTGVSIQPAQTEAGELVLAKARALTQTAAPRNRSTEAGYTSAEQSTDSDKDTGTRSKDVAREIAAHSFLRSNLEGLDLVQSQTASSQLQKRATDFVWRRVADVPDAREATSVDSNPRQKGISDSLLQSPRSSRTITPESTSRKVEPGPGSRLMTERIVRNISRKLLIERERRGY